jgi:hypothetical protein
MSTAPIPASPGGTLTCPPGYIPVVTRNKSTGVIAAECMDVSYANSSVEVGNILLGRLFGQKRRPDDEITPSEQEILDRGRYEDFEREYSFDVLTLFRPA